MQRFLIALCCAVCASLGTAGSAAAAQNELVTQLAQSHVDITARFTGERVLIFGAVSHPGDVVIKVASPDETVAITRKAQYGPFWLTAGKFTVEDAPGLLYMLSTRPVGELLDSARRDRYGLSLRHNLQGARAKGLPAGMDNWQDAFLQLKANDGYYLKDGQAVKMVGDRLFSASVALPAKLPLGEYQLTIYLVREGKVVAQQTRKLDVREVQMERWISDVAFQHSWLFGTLFVLLAMVIGLVLGIVLRRGGDD